MRRRDGRTVRSTSNMQFFYGPTGTVRLIFSSLFFLARRTRESLTSGHWRRSSI